MSVETSTSGMRRHIEAFDWERTSAGARSAWPPVLQMMVHVMLDSRFPMLIWWGDDHVQIYNDAYIPLMGARHPLALGQTLEAAWPEVWETVGPMVHGVRTTGEAIWAENMPFDLRRNGYDERAYFTFCYSRIGAAGAAGGVLCTNVETTASVALLERERERSLAFQQAALPLLLPRLPGIAFDAIYEAADGDAMIGGDWYDAFRLSDGRVVISVGDVIGSGLAAAVTMVATRQAIRGAAQVFPEPAAVLDAADRALRSEQPDRIVTTFLGILDPLTLSFTYASAGHPPPLLRRPDGTIDELASADLPLGLRNDVPATGNVTIGLPQGSLLVLYTDGLTESTRDVLEGDRRLRSALERHDVHDAANPAEAIRRTVLDRASDDVAILTMRLVPDFERVTRWSFSSSDAQTATNVRREFATILRNAGASEAETCDAELVFGELIGNVVRHTEGGEVEIALDLTDGAPVLHMLDRGPGFTFYARLPNDSMSESGRGLFIATSFSRDVSVTRRVKGGSHARVVLNVRLAAVAS
jgi:anti-sigma regulatory factor (Ser/Thr protein kinase)